MIHKCPNTITHVVYDIYFCQSILLIYCPSSVQMCPSLGIWEYITHREKGITTLRKYQYWKFHHTVIKTCFKMLKSFEHEKSWLYSNNKSPNFKIVLKLDQLIPQLYFLYQILRIGSLSITRVTLIPVHIKFYI